MAQLTQGEDDYGLKAVQKYPGFKRVYKQGVQVMDASPERIKSAPQWTSNRVSEFYFPGEKGGMDMLPNPTDGKKAAIEIYNKDYTSKNPAAKDELIVGELLHGMRQDPGYAKLRKQFSQNFTPEEVKLQKASMKNPKSDFYSEIPGETHQQMMERSGIDAYIRAHFMPNSPGSSEWKSAYSPKQRQIIQQIHTYLKTDPTQDSRPKAQQQIDRAVKNRALRNGQ